MRRHWGVRIWKFLLAAVVAVLIGGVVVMWLWNSFVPEVFGWRAITFGQAVGLLVLSRILFGRPRLSGPWHGIQWRRRMWGRWEQMTPEERERFRAALRARCGTSDSEPHAGPSPTPQTS